MKSRHVVLVGKNKRISVIHRNCIRIEFSGDGVFTDAPTLFASQRDACFKEFSVSSTAKSITIDTGAIILTCKKDDSCPNPHNLHAKIRHGEKTITWVPGQHNSGNLGGTAETLDGWTESRPLADGILSRDGWFLLDDSGTPILADGWIKRRGSTGSDSYLFGYGSDYRSAFKALAAISGPVPLPRRYTLGAWYSRYWPYTSAEYRKIVAEYAEKDFPLDVIVMDMDWHINDARKAFGPDAPANKQVWTGYTWDRDLLPDAEKLLAWFHEQGLAVTLNDHPADGVRPFEKPYAAFMRALGKDPKCGETIDFDAADREYMEAFYRHTHANLEKDGVDFWWLDWQQYRQTRSLPELTNLQWLNYVYYQKVRNKGMRGQSFSRWGGWGDHRNPIHFSGDADTRWDMLAAEVPFTATAGNVGCFFWSHDIGGHQGGRNEESYVRWCQFGALSAALRSHSTRNEEMDRRPWTYPKWAERSMHMSFHLRSELFPYIYTCVANACRDTVPFIRPMYIDYPNIEEAYKNPQQYLLGDNLLVAPVTEPGIGRNKLARQAVWFPEGNWYHYFSGEMFSGSQEELIPSTIDEFPLFVRAGVALPMQEYTPRMSSSPLNRLVLRYWPGPDGQRFTSEVYEDDGVSEGYCKGEFARTEIASVRENGVTGITVSPVTGDYPGCVRKRAYRIELFEIDRPEEITLDGKPVGIRYDKKLRMACVEVPECSVSSGFDLQVRAATADREVARINAYFRRTGKSHTGKSIADSLRDALQSGKEEAAQLALRAAGVGLFPKNQTYYGYPKKNEHFLYLPEELRTDNNFQAHLQEHTWKAGLKKGRTHIALAAALKKITPPADELMYAGFSEQLRVMTGVCGRRIELEAPVHYTEPFWKFRRNLAPAATASASSHLSDQPPTAAIDGVVDGIPDNRFREWATDGERAGAWLKLEWKTPVRVREVWLFDRPNRADHVIAGKVMLSDGSVFHVGELPNDGKSPFKVTFPARNVDWLVFVVTKVSDATGWAGLSEIAVY